MTPIARRSFLGATLGVLLCPRTAGADAVGGKKLDPNKLAPYWNPIPNSALGASGLFPYAFPAGVGGSAADQFAPWCGGAYADSLRKFLMGLHGGHAAGNDNSPYAFSLETLKWTRLAPPAPVKNGDMRSGEYEMQYGGTSRHTYGGVIWAENAKRLLIGGAYAIAAGPGGGPWLLDPATGAYERADNAPIGTIGSYDPERGLCLCPVRGRFRIYDAATRSVVKEVPTGGYFDYFAASAYDTKRKRMVYFVTGIGTVVELASLDTISARRFSQSREALTRTGSFTRYYPLMANPIADADVVQVGDGLAYHPGRDKLYAWGGGRDLKEIDPETFQVTKIVTPLDKPAPEASSYQGIYGRWRYVAEFDCFLAIPTNANANVWLYKLPA